MDGGKVLRAGIALAGVGGKTIDANAEAAFLVGKELSPSNIVKVAELVAAKAEPRTDHRGSSEYKRQIVRTFVTRILTAQSAQKVA
jgi:carbon-monoxide dehydrogenase medium subunit